MPLENPFRSVPPKELDPNQEEFLRKFGGADDEGLKAAGVTGNDEGLVNRETIDGEIVEGLDANTTPEEREAFLDAIVEFKGTQIMRRDLMALETLIKQINIDNEIDGEKTINLGDAGWELGSNRITMSSEESSRVKEITLSYTPISSFKDVKFPDHLIELWLSGIPLATITDIEFPESLRVLGLSNTNLYSLENVKLPSELSTLYLENTGISLLDDVDLPSTNFNIYLKGTPLARDYRSIRALKEKYPNINIFTDDSYTPA